MNAVTHTENTALAAPRGMGFDLSPQTFEQPMTQYRCSECGAWHVGSTTHRPQPMRWVNNNHELRMT